MRVMVIIKATKESEKGLMPKEKMEKMFADMAKYNEELVKAGVMQSGDGLKPSSFGKRVNFVNGKASVVIDGPFAETKELIAGYWVWKVKSMEEAVAWALRCPDPMANEDAQIELRPFYELEDFGEAFTPELRAQDDRLRAEMERQK